MTRSEHLQWAKNRALEYADAGDLLNALASLTSDLEKHPETKGHIGVQLGMMEMLAGTIKTPAQMRAHIEGYN